MSQDIQFRVYNCVCDSPDPIGRADIAKLTGLPERTVSDALHKLSKRKGLVRFVGGYKHSRWVRKGERVMVWKPSAGINPNSLAALRRINGSGRVQPFGAGECLLAKLW